jgi:hypothetical protein
MKINLTTEGIKGNGIEVGKTSIELECTVDEVFEALHKLEKDEDNNTKSEFSNVVKEMKEYAKLKDIPIITASLIAKENKESDNNDPVQELLRRIMYGTCSDADLCLLEKMKAKAKERCESAIKICKKDQSADDLFNDIIIGCKQNAHSVTHFVDLLTKAINDEKNFKNLENNLTFEPFITLFKYMAYFYADVMIPFYATRAVTASKLYEESKDKPIINSAPDKCKKLILSTIKDRNNCCKKGRIIPTDEIFYNIIKSVIPEDVYKKLDYYSGNEAAIKLLELFKDNNNKYDFENTLEFKPFISICKKIAARELEISELGVAQANTAILAAECYKYAKKYEEFRDNNKDNKAEADPKLLSVITPILKKFNANDTFYEMLCNAINYAEKCKDGPDHYENVIIYNKLKDLLTKSETNFERELTYGPFRDTFYKIKDGFADIQEVVDTMKNAMSWYLQEVIKNPEHQNR